MADVKSTTGQIKFDTQLDNQAEMTLNETGLGIGITPSANLHVNGNAIVTEKMFVGGSSGSSNLNLNGTIGFDVQTISANATLGNSTVVLVDSSSDNITLTLPYAGNVNGRQYQIKKISASNSVWISGGGNLIDDTCPIELPASSDLASVIVISDGSQWYKIQQKDISETVASDNLIGWWKLDEVSGTTAYDSSGFDRHGTLNGSSFSSNSIIGKVSNGLYFDGNDDNIDLGTNSFLGLGNYSVSVWYKSSSTSRGPLLESYSGGGIALNANRACLTPSTGDLSFVGTNTGATCYATTVGAALNDNNWHLIVFIRESDTSGTVFYDNSIMNSGALQSGSHQKGSITIGSDGGLANFLTGSLDDIRIYNKALTTSEVQALYNQGQ